MVVIERRKLDVVVLLEGRAWESEEMLFYLLQERGLEHQSRLPSAT